MTDLISMLSNQLYDNLASSVVSLQGEEALMTDRFSDFLESFVYYCKLINWHLSFIHQVLVNSTSTSPCLRNPGIFKRLIF